MNLKKFKKYFKLEMKPNHQEHFSSATPVSERAKILSKEILSARVGVGLSLLFIISVITMALFLPFGNNSLLNLQFQKKASQAAAGCGLNGPSTIAVVAGSSTTVTINAGANTDGPWAPGFQGSGMLSAVDTNGEVDMGGGGTMSTTSTYARNSVPFGVVTIPLTFSIPTNLIIDGIPTPAAGRSYTLQQLVLIDSSNNSNFVSCSGQFTINITAPAPAVNLLANGSNGSTSVIAGETVLLTWSSTNSPISCTASNDGGITNWNASVPASDTLIHGGVDPHGVTVNATTTFTLSCTNSGGSNSDSVTVNVSPAPTAPPTGAPTPTAAPFTVSLVPDTTASNIADEAGSPITNGCNAPGSLHQADAAMRFDWSTSGGTAAGVYLDGWEVPVTLKEGRYPETGTATTNPVVINGWKPNTLYSVTIHTTSTTGVVAQPVTKSFTTANCTVPSPTPTPDPSCRFSPDNTFENITGGSPQPFILNGRNLPVGNIAVGLTDGGGTDKLFNDIGNVFDFYPADPGMLTLNATSQSIVTTTITDNSKDFNFTINPAPYVTQGSHSIGAVYLINNGDLTNKIQCVGTGGLAGLMIHALPTTVTIQGHFKEPDGTDFSNVGTKVTITGGSTVIPSQTEPFWRFRTLKANVSYTVTAAALTGYTISFKYCLNAAMIHYPNCPAIGSGASQVGPLTLTQAGNYLDVYFTYTPVTASPSPTAPPPPPALPKCTFVPKGTITNTFTILGGIQQSFTLSGENLPAGNVAVGITNPNETDQLFNDIGNVFAFNASDPGMLTINATTPSIVTTTSIDNSKTFSFTINSAPYVTKGDYSLGAVYLINNGDLTKKTQCSGGGGLFGLMIHAQPTTITIQGLFKQADGVTPFNDLRTKVTVTGGPTPIDPKTTNPWFFHVSPNVSYTVTATPITGFSISYQYCVNDDAKNYPSCSSGIGGRVLNNNRLVGVSSTQAGDFFDIYFIYTPNAVNPTPTPSTTVGTTCNTTTTSLDIVKGTTGTVPVSYTIRGTDTWAPGYQEIPPASGLNAVGPNNERALMGGGQSGLTVSPASSSRLNAPETGTVNYQFFVDNDPDVLVGGDYTFANLVLINSRDQSTASCSGQFTITVTAPPTTPTPAPTATGTPSPSATTNPTPTAALAACTLSPNNQVQVNQGGNYTFTLSGTNFPAGSAYAKVIFSNDGTHKFFYPVSTANGDGNPVKLSNTASLLATGTGQTTVSGGNASFTITFQSSPNDDIGDYTIGNVVIQNSAGADIGCKGTTNGLFGLKITVISTTVTIQGHHVGANGADLTLPGQQVILSSGFSNSLSSTSSPAYSFSNITPGSYTVTATDIPNYTISSASIITQAGQSCSLPLHPEISYTNSKAVTVNLATAGSCSDVYFKYVPTALPPTPAPTATSTCSLVGTPPTTFTIPRGGNASLQVTVSGQSVNGGLWAPGLRFMSDVSLGEDRVAVNSDNAPVDLGNPGEVQFKVGDISQTRFVLPPTRTIDYIFSASSTALTGAYTLKNLVMVYATDNLVEKDKNCSGQIVINVTDPTAKADLVVDNITLTPANPGVGVPVTASVTVKNVGTLLTGTSVPVKFWPHLSLPPSYTTAGDPKVLAQLTPTLLPNQSTAIVFSFTSNLTPGNYQAYSVVDDGDPGKLDEVDDTLENNRKNLSYYVGQPPPFANCNIQGDSSLDITQGGSTIVTVQNSQLSGAGGPWRPGVRFTGPPTYVLYASNVIDIVPGLRVSMTPVGGFNFPTTNSIVYTFSADSNAQVGTTDLANLVLVNENDPDNLVANCTGKVTINVKAYSAPPSRSPLNNPRQSGCGYLQPCQSSAGGTWAHPAIDIDSTTGDLTVVNPYPVPVIVFSVVYDRGNQTGYGNVLLVQTLDGRYEALFAHLAFFSVGRGDIVQPGQKLGDYDTTGFATGPHLHYENMEKNLYTGLYDYVDPTEKALAGAPTPVPDLVITNVSLNKTAFYPGETLAPTATIKNQGTGSTINSFDIGWGRNASLSGCSFGDPNQCATGISPQTPMAAGEIRTVTLPGYLVPDQPGSYTVYVMADSGLAVPESNDNNNQSLGISYTVSQPAPTPPPTATIAPSPSATIALPRVTLNDPSTSYSGFDFADNEVTNGCIKEGTQTADASVKFTWSGTNVSGYYLEWSGGRYPEKPNEYMPATQTEQKISGWASNTNYTISLLAKDNSAIKDTKTFKTSVCRVTIQGKHLDKDGKLLTTNIGQAVTLNTGAGVSQLGNWFINDLKPGNYTVTANPVSGYTISYSFLTSPACTNCPSPSTTSFTTGNTLSVNLPTGGYYGDIYFRYTPQVTSAPADTQLPTVQIVDPTQGSSRTGNIPVTIDAKDNVAIRAVELYIDNGYLDSSSTVNSDGHYIIPWNSSGTTTGTHRITAIAYDTANNSKSASVDVTITPPSLPAGVTGVGDSILVSVTSALQSAIADFDIDASIGRQVAEGIDVLTNKANAGNLRSKVLVELGTNGTFTSDQFDQIMAIVGSRQVFFVNNAGQRTWIPGNNTMIAGGVARYSNAHLIDWEATSRGRSDYFYSDGIHPNPTGQAVYVSLVVNALNGTTIATVPITATCSIGQNSLTITQGGSGKVSANPTGNGSEYWAPGFTDLNNGTKTVGSNGAAAVFQNGITMTSNKPRFKLTAAGVVGGGAVDFIFNVSANSSVGVNTLANLVLVYTADNSVQTCTGTFNINVTSPIAPSPSTTSVPLATCNFTGTPTNSIEVTKGKSTTVAFTVTGDAGPWAPGIIWSSGVREAVNENGSPIIMGNGLSISASPARLTSPSNTQVNFVFSATTDAVADTYFVKDLMLVHTPTNLSSTDSNCSKTNGANFFLTVTPSSQTGSGLLTTARICPEQCTKAQMQDFIASNYNSTYQDFLNYMINQESSYYWNVIADDGFNCPSSNPCYGILQFMSQTWDASHDRGFDKGTWSPEDIYPNQDNSSTVPAVGRGIEAAANFPDNNIWNPYGQIEVTYQKLLNCEDREWPWLYDRFGERAPGCG